MRGAYYNEIDPNAAEWLRQLIKMGEIAPGDVDERSIEDVTPDELTPYTQCHFFAGIGGWSLALRLAGWPDDRPVWTGSCPCQPFSAAGKGSGIADERHLWPALFWLIQQCRPETVFGEQVASKDGLGWWDIVSADLEGTGYASTAFDLCVAGIGAPHIRQRLFWVANTENVRNRRRFQQFPRKDEIKQTQKEPGQNKTRQPVYCGDSNSPWENAEWVECRDGRKRAAQPGIFPLVNGLPSGVGYGGDISPQTAQNTAEGRVMRLKGYGNAIVPKLAAEFIAAYTPLTTTLNTPLQPGVDYTYYPPLSRNDLRKKYPNAVDIASASDYSKGVAQDLAMTAATANQLAPAEQARRDLAAQSDGLLVEAWDHGYLWALTLASDDAVDVSIVGGARPYRVTYPSSGDRMVRGELRAVDYERSRSFAKVESLFKFLREF